MVDASDPNDAGDPHGEGAVPLSSLPEHATGRRVTVPGAPANGVFVDYGPGRPPPGGGDAGDPHDPNSQYGDPNEEPDPSDEVEAESGPGEPWGPRRRKRRRRGFRPERWKPEDAVGPYGFKSGSR